MNYTDIRNLQSSGTGKDNQLFLNVELPLKIQAAMGSIPPALLCQKTRR